MNKIEIALLCAFAAVLAACCNNNVVPPDPVDPDPVESRTLSFVLPAVGEDGAAVLKTAWQAGDQIVVHGEYARDQVTVTLDGSDISADGKTATKTVDGLHPYRREDCASVLYASYPASAVSNLKHCFFYSAFKSENVQLMAACNTADTFEFHNLTGVVTFKVSGDYDSYTFTGRKEATVNYSLYQVKITDTETDLKQFLQDPSSSVTRPVVADGQTDNVLYIPGGVDLVGGFILQLFKDGQAVKGLTDKDAFELKLGDVLSLGDITAQLVDVGDDIDPDLATAIDTKDHANCYLISAPGIFKFSAVQGNSETPVGAADHAVILWETQCNDAEITSRSVLKGVSFDEESNYMCFQVPDPVQPGNALIAVLDKNERVLWSWHIWIPATPVTADTYGFGSFKMMCRNLGALVDTQPGAPADPRSFGLLYQWGRKDPFLGARAIDSAEPVAFAGTAMTVAEGIIAPEESIAIPTTLVNVEGAWCTGNDNMMWGDVERESSAPKSVYDPCPAGYRIPGRKHFTIFQNDGTGLSGWNYDAANGVVQIGSPVAAFPICGYLKNDGTFAGGSAIVWDARNDYENGQVSYCMFIDGGNSRKTGKTRAFGGSVRCEAE